MFLVPNAVMCRRRVARHPCTSRLEGNPSRIVVLLRGPDDHLEPVVPNSGVHLAGIDLAATQGGLTARGGAVALSSGVLPVVCENLADGLRGLAVIELEHATEPLTTPYLARSQ
jgi:hypothetical protein